MRSSFLIAFSAIVAAGLLAACTIEETDEPIDNGTGGSGGTAGSSTGGSAQGGAAQGGSAQGGASGEGGAATGGAAGEGGAGTGGTAGAAGSGSQDKKVGEYCEDDSFCLPGLKCIVPAGTEFFGGGPANGYCTVSCTQDQNACAAFTGTTCVDLSVTTEISAWCLASCATGQGDKNCYGRADVACSNLGPLQEGGADVVACVPVCATDSDCGGGNLICDKRLNVCVPQAAGGSAALGTACDPNNDTCQGKCLTVLDSNNAEVSFCSQRCVYGNDSACGQDVATPGVDAGVCLLGAVGGEDIGDEAFCAKFCDKNEDCPTGLTCDLSNPVHNHGYCIPQ